MQPDFLVKETLSTLGVLGESSEPLLSTAISKITGASRMMRQSPGKEFDFLTDSKSILGIQNQMYLEKAPEGLLRALE